MPDNTITIEGRELLQIDCGVVVESNSGLFRRVGKIDTENEYPYEIAVDARDYFIEANELIDLIGILCAKHDVDGQLNGLFIEPKNGVVYDRFEIFFEAEEKSIIKKFAEDFFLKIE